MTPALDRARTYLAACPPAVSGQSGHNTAFSVVSNVVNGFDLTEQEAIELLADWNRTCQPPWSDSELRHKVRDALNVGKVPKGSKLKGIRHRYGGTETGPQRAAAPARTSDPARPAPVPQNGKPVPRMPKVAVPFDAELPDPLPDPTRALLRAAFLEGESVRIVGAHTNEEGKEVPRDAGVILTREEWLRRLDEGRTYRKALVHDGNALFGGTDRNGIFVGINPMSGPRDSDVTAYRHALIEWDTLPREDQWHIISESGLPCTAVIGSGGKSVHAWVRVDARDRREYDERVRIIHEFLAEHQIDPKNKNPSRFSRLPGCDRGEKRQELLALKTGAESFDQWLVATGAGIVGDSTLPAIESALHLIADETVREPEEIVQGVLHRGMKGVLGSSSKARKTWILLDLALSVASGGKWWSWQCSRGKVLWINFEIARPFVRSRVAAVANAKGITDVSGLDIWTLRGHAAPLWQLLPDLTRQIQLRGYSLVIIDPIYKGLGGRDENSAGEISELCNEVEKLSVDTGAAVIYAAHYSKGNQAAKSAIDRISGSGVFGRDADTLVCLTPLETPDAFAVELVLRNHPEHPPFAVAWEYPLMTVRDDLDPSKLAQPKAGRPRVADLDALIDLLGHDGLTSKDWLEAAIDRCGVSKTAFYRHKSELEKERRIAFDKVAKRYVKNR